uniref:Dolichyl-diphosphooligosaccharide--protein glycosyltransferase subunit 2 n=1 Tax=Lactuca sativa TaxID=4236 RepID=A0A9R1VC87_LACSA|nr:hypothetical protein LSAT_V11C500239610 [Lactuca sativa]
MLHLPPSSDYIKALKEDVVKLFENLDKYDSGANFFDDQYQGPVSATSSVVRGLTTFASASGNTRDKILGLARFFLGIGIPGNSKDLYHQIDALDCLDQKRQCLKLIVGVCEQTCAGVVVLTDLVFWCLLLPFQSGDGFQLTLLIGCMHSLNAVFLLLDSALNILVTIYLARINILCLVELSLYNFLVGYACLLLYMVALSLPGNCYSMGSHVVLWHHFSSPSMLQTICLACESESIDAIKNVSASIYSPTCGFCLQSTKEKDHTTR